MKKFITYIFAVVVLAVSSVFTANAQYIKNPTDTTKVSLYETPQYQDALHEFNAGQNMFFCGITCAAVGCTGIYLSQNTMPRNTKETTITTLCGSAFAITGIVLTSIGCTKMERSFLETRNLKVNYMLYSNGLFLLF